MSGAQPASNTALQPVHLRSSRAPWQRFERRARPFEQARAATAPNLSPVRAFDARAPFFVMIKDLTVIGYFSSESGATQELRYNPVPGRFNGDVPFSEVGRRWSW